MAISSVGVHIKAQNSGEVCPANWERGSIQVRGGEEGGTEGKMEQPKPEGGEGLEGGSLGCCHGNFYSNDTGV